MRILQICSARQIGGGENHLIDLANGLARRGHDLYAALRPNSALLPGLSELRQQNIRQIPLRNALDLQSAVQIARFVREHKIEIVHAHLARDYPLAAFAAMRERRAKLIVTRHVLFPLNKLHKWTFTRAAGVIAVSEAVARTLLDSRIVDKEKIAVILNGIDIDKFGGEEMRAQKKDLLHQQRNADEATRLLVGAVGQLDPLKGHEDFVRAAALIHARNPFADFVIIGEDASRTGEHRARLEKLISELKLEKGFRLAGWTNDVPSVLRTFDVFVSASRNESFGLAIAEAMASGLAVVATMSAGAKEIIENNVTGKLVSVGDIEAMASAINSLLSDEGVREKFGENARHAAREKFSLERMVDATERVYRDALKHASNDEA